MPQRAPQQQTALGALGGGDLLLRNARLVDSDGGVTDGGLIARDGVIATVFAGEPPRLDRDCEEVDAGGRYVLPGLIDPHVQLYPLPDWAHYVSETASAALGGVTTIVKMHRDLEGYEPAVFATEVAAAEARAHVDFSFHLALMTDSQIAAVPELARSLELTSFKVFMAYKGAEGTPIGIQGLDDGQLLDALRAVAGVGGVVLVHAENQEIAARARSRVDDAATGLRAWAESRPPIVEAEAVRRVAFLANEAGCPLYVVHVTSEAGLRELAEVRAPGQRLWIETEPHYLTETVDSEAGVLAKVIPPIRFASDRAALWQALEAGRIDSIGSDHVMALRERKGGSLWTSQLGFAGIATILPALLSYGVAPGRLTLADVVRITSTNPAQIFGFSGKGRLLPGRDADFVVIDLDLEREVQAEMLGSASDFSIYEGRTLRGWPVLTACRGRVVMRDGKIVGEQGHGRYLRRLPQAGATA